MTDSKPQDAPQSKTLAPPVNAAPLATPRTETEVAMEAFRDIAKVMSDSRLAETREEQETERLKINADKIVRLADNKHHGQVMLWLLILAAVGGGLAFLANRPDLGTTVVSSTVTGVLGFLAGKAVGEKAND